MKTKYDDEILIKKWLNKVAVHCIKEDIKNRGEMDKIKELFNRDSLIHTKTMREC